MYIEAVLNRNSPPAILLRESFREGGRKPAAPATNLKSNHLLASFISRKFRLEVKAQLPRKVGRDLYRDAKCGRSDH